MARLRQVEILSRRFLNEHRLTTPQPGDVFELAEPFGMGGFGTVHEVTQGPAGATGSVVKVYEPKPLREALGGHDALAHRLRTLTAALDAADPHWPLTLLAVPYGIAAADVAGAPRTVVFMLHLGRRGYVGLDLDADGQRRYLRRDVRQRIQLATSFAVQAELLESAKFVHADLNPENVLVNFTTRDVQVIDFDAGGVIAPGGQPPATTGKTNECMPPEVKGVDGATVSPEAERWAVGTMVGWLVLGHHPLPYLSAISAKVIDAYARDPRGWPHVSDQKLLSPDPARRRMARTLPRRLERLPDGFTETMRRFFAAGTDGAARPTSAEWAAALSDLRKPPTLDLVHIDSVTLPGEPVTLRWVARNATHVEVEDVPGTHPSAGETSVTPLVTRGFLITAYNPYGQVSTRSPLVRVIQYPELAYVPVPDFSGVHLEVELDVPRVRPFELDLGGVASEITRSLQARQPLEWTLPPLVLPARLTVARAPASPSYTIRAPIDLLHAQPTAPAPRPTRRRWFRRRGTATA